MPDEPRGTEPPGHAVEQLVEHRRDLRRRASASAERALRTHRASPAPGLHRPRVAVVRERVQVTAGRRTEHGHHRVLPERGDLDPPCGCRARGACGRSRARRPTDGRPGARAGTRARGRAGTTSRPSGFATRRRDLGQELRAGAADRDAQPDPVEHVAPELRGDLLRRARHSTQPADVEEGLVDRDALDDGRRRPEHLEHRPAGLGVRRHAGRDDDRVRAELAGLAPAHGAAHAEGPGFVARGHDDAAAHDDRAAAQARIVALLDRREERVEVGVQDRGDRRWRLTRTHVRTSLPRPRPARMARSYIFYDSMDLDPTDEQRSIIDVFGALADRTCPVDRLREHEPLGFSPELWAQLVAVGAPGMAVPEDAGGAGAALLDLSLAVEALGRRLAPAPLVEHAVTARLLARVDALPAEVLDGDAPGDARAPARGATTWPASYRRARSPGWSSRSTATTSWRSCHRRVTSCPTSRRRRWPTGPSRRTRSRSAPCWRRARRPRELHAHAVDEWRVLTAAALAGLGLGALAIAITYVTEREQFGVPIGSFQSIQHGLADVAVALDGAQLLARKAAWAFDAERDDAAQLARDGVPLLRRACPARRRTCAALPRRLRLHGGVRHPALLPTGQGVGERARRARTRVRRVSPTCGTARSWRRWPEWTSPRLPSAVQFGNEVRDADRRRVHRRGAPTRARHRHHARLGPAPGDRRPGLDRAGAPRGARRRRARPRGAGGAVPGARARGRAVRRAEHLHDGRVGHRARRATRCSGRSSSRSCWRASR